MTKAKKISGIISKMRILTVIVVFAVVFNLGVTNVVAAARPWQTVYAERVRYYARQIHPEGVADFLLHDIDGDGVPEIIIMVMETSFLGGFPEMVTHIAAYTFRDGQLIELQFDANVEKDFTGRFFGGGTIFYSANDITSSLLYRTSSAQDFISIA